MEKTSLAPYNTFGIDVKADLRIIENVEQLQDFLHNFSGRFKILGGGSNLLLTKDPKETILLNRILGIEIVNENSENVVVKVGGGQNWHEFVLWSINKNLGGLENLSLIPGTVGAAPIQNIGAYGVEQNRCFLKLEAIDLVTKEQLEFSIEECNFGYRDSIFKNELKGKVFITAVYYQLTKNHDLVLDYGIVKDKLAENQVKIPTIRDVSNVIISIRKSKLPDPKEIGNSGSFFKNPIVSIQVLKNIQSIFNEVPYYPIDEISVKLPAAWLIDQCGWKGKVVGNTGTYHNQALVIVNHGGASGEEIWNFAESIINSVSSKFGIKLVPEVNIW